MEGGGSTYPDLTSHTLTTLSHPPLTTSAFGWPHPSEAKHGSLCRPGTYVGAAGRGAIPFDRLFKF
jgi:hypothetical protein